MKKTIHDPIRPLNVYQDLLEVSDLIENSFDYHMDDEGRQYLQQIRKTALNPSLVRWIPGARERASYPLNGYVWEENNQIIGNISIFPYLHKFKWYYLIANLAVDPNHRGSGIGKELTRIAIDHASTHGASAVWLQVRDDNPIATNLYQSLGFHKKCRRTTWHTMGKVNPPESEDGQILIRNRKNQDWEKQSTWLSLVYPREITWYLQFSVDELKPGLIRKIFSFFQEKKWTHLSAEKNQAIIGSASLELRNHFSSVIWLAPSPAAEKEAITALLPPLIRLVQNGHRILINYPAGKAEEAFVSLGLIKQNTLIWMEYNFN